MFRTYIPPADFNVEAAQFRPNPRRGAPEPPPPQIGFRLLQKRPLEGDAPTRVAMTVEMPAPKVRRTDRWERREYFRGAHSSGKKFNEQIKNLSNYDREYAAFDEKKRWSVPILDAAIEYAKKTNLPVMSETNILFKNRALEKNILFNYVSKFEGKYFKSGEVIIANANLDLPNETTETTITMAESNPSKLKIVLLLVSPVRDDNLKTTLAQALSKKKETITPDPVFNIPEIKIDYIAAGMAAPISGLITETGSTRPALEAGEDPESALATDPPPIATPAIDGASPDAEDEAPPPALEPPTTPDLDADGDGAVVPGADGDGAVVPGADGKKKKKRIPNTFFRGPDPKYRPLPSKADLDDAEIYYEQPETRDASKALVLQQKLEAFLNLVERNKQRRKEVMVAVLGGLQDARENIISNRLAVEEARVAEEKARAAEEEALAADVREKSAANELARKRKLVEIRAVRNTIETKEDWQREITETLTNLLKRAKPIKPSAEAIGARKEAVDAANEVVEAAESALPPSKVGAPTDLNATVNEDELESPTRGSRQRVIPKTPSSPIIDELVQATDANRTRLRELQSARIQETVNEQEGPTDEQLLTGKYRPEDFQKPPDLETARQSAINAYITHLASQAAKKKPLQEEVANYIIEMIAILTGRGVLKGDVDENVALIEAVINAAANQKDAKKVIFLKQLRAAGSGFEMGGNFKSAMDSIISASLIAQDTVNQQYLYAVRIR